MGRILSGVQPTGSLHIGNYLGAIKQWVAMQHNHDSFFCIVDLHAVTVPYEPKHLRDNSLLTAATYLACGIDPKHSVIFNQSMVSEHSELAWILSCITPMGWLNRMTQFKDKAGKDKEKASVGLYTYPILMAADILIYHATHVPVGEDQKQHLELARDIAGAFNRKFECDDFFPLPEPLILKTTARIMSLKDGKAKMSKSDPSDYSRILLVDDPDTIALKIKKAKSDAITGISYDVEQRPEVSNLIEIFAAFSNRSEEDIVSAYANAPMSRFKDDLANLVTEKLSPIRKNILHYMSDKAELARLLQQGGEKASSIATVNLQKIKEIMGFFVG